MENQASNYNHESVKGCATVIVLLLFCALFLHVCSNSRDTEEAKNKDQSIDPIEAHFEAERFVKKRLKSPSSAEFCLRRKDNVIQINDSTFMVNNCFDSQNGFGAIIRSEYSCKVTFFIEKDLVKCEDLVIK